MPLLYTNRDLEQFPWYVPVSRIIQDCNDLRQFQEADGSFLTVSSGIKRSFERIIEQVQVLHNHFASQYMAALLRDLQEWVANGLDIKPSFNFSLSRYEMGKNHEFQFLLYPVQNITRNPDRIYLEAFVCYRNESKQLDHLRSQYPHVIFQAVELVLSSQGLIQSNVFNLFPESVSVETLEDQKKFAFFFLNKYVEVYEKISKPIGQFLLGTELNVLQLTEDEIYDARQLLSYLHDHFHYQGTLPLDEFITLKLTLIAGCVEEMRVDVMSYLELLTYKDPIYKTASELFLLERIYRYAYTDNPIDSSDCLTNQFLFNYLLFHKAISFQQKKLYYHFEQIEACLQQLVLEINGIERRLCGSPSNRYEQILSEWTMAYLPRDSNGDMCRSLFTEWLNQQGEKLGIPHVIELSSARVVDSIESR